MPTVNRLTEVKTLELSVVPRGANNKRIAIAKGQNMSFAEVLQSVLETKAEGEDQAIANLGELSEKADAAARAHFRLNVGFSDAVQKEHFEAIAKAAGYEVPAGEPVVKTVTKADPELRQEFAKALEAKDAQIEEIKKSFDALNEKATKASLRHEIEKDFAKVPGNTVDEMVEILHKADQADMGDVVRKSWKVAAEAADQVLKSAGKPGGNANALDEGRVQELAKSYEGSGMSRYEALKKAHREAGTYAQSIQQPQAH